MFDHRRKITYDPLNQAPPHEDIYLLPPNWKKLSYQLSPSTATVPLSLCPDCVYRIENACPALASVFKKATESKRLPHTRD